MDPANRDEYRRAKIAQTKRNQELLAQSGVSDAANEISRLTEPPPSKKRVREIIGDDAEPAGPRRRSGRAAGLPPEQQKTRRDQEEKEVMRQVEAQRQKKHEPRELEALTSVTDSNSLDSLFETTSRFSKERVGNFPAALTNPTASPTKRKVAMADLNLEEVEKELDGLVLRDFAKVTTGRIYSVLVHPSEVSDICFVGDKEGNIAMVDFTTEGKPEHWYWSAHTSTVSCMRFPPPGTAGSTTKLYSGSYDATVRVTDLVTGHSEEVIDIDRLDDNEALVHAFDFVPNGQEIWACDNNGGLTHRDLREPIQLVRRWKVCDKKLGCLSLNPVNPNLAVTSHLGRSMKLWDLSKLQGTPPDLDPSSYANSTLAQYPYVKACSSAYFSRDGTRILSTSYDDHCRLWNIDPYSPPTLSKEFKPFREISHNNQTGRYTSVFKGQWATSSSSHFTIGNMEQALDVIDVNGAVLASLGDEDRIPSVPAVTGSHPTRSGRLYGGHTAGKVSFFAPPS